MSVSPILTFFPNLLDTILAGWFSAFHCGSLGFAFDDNAIILYDNVARFY